MTGTLMKIFGAEINDLTFVGSNSAFSKNGRGKAEAKLKRVLLATEKLQME